MKDNSKGVATSLKDWSMNILGDFKKVEIGKKKDLEACRRSVMSR